MGVPRPQGPPCSRRGHLTYDLEVDLGFRQFGVYRFRLRAVDTPEIYGQSKDSEEYQRGAQAKAYVEQWFDERPEDATYWVRTYDEQTFNRWVADVYLAWYDGETEQLADALRANGYAD